MKCANTQNQNSQQPCPMQLAELYIKWQPYVTLYEPCEALRNGTVFPNLNFPYTKNVK